MPRCTAITQSGSRCKRSAEAGGTLCATHAGTHQPSQSQRKGKKGNGIDRRGRKPSKFERPSPSGERMFKFAKSGVPGEGGMLTVLHVSEYFDAVVMVDCPSAGVLDIDVDVLANDAFRRRYGTAASANLFRYLDARSNSALNIFIKVYARSFFISDGFGKGNVYIQWFRNFVTATSRERLDQLEADLGVPDSVFRGLGAKTMCLLFAYLVDAQIMLPHEPVTLRADGEFISKSAKATADRMPLARYYHDRFGFVPDPKLVPNLGSTVPFKHEIPMASSVARIMDVCSGRLQRHGEA